MHACPCCGYRTLPGRGDYDLCPVCGWEDDGIEPWEYSDPNAQILFEAQREYLAEQRSRRRRPKRLRGPRKSESREPGWQPIALTDDLAERMRRAREEERLAETGRQRIAKEIADDPEGPFKAYNAAVDSLRAKAVQLSHVELKDQLGRVSSAHGIHWPEAYLELLSRLLSNKDYYRRHPIRQARLMLRYARPGTYKQRWEEVRTGTFRVAG
jgi:hypothetical protein